LIRSLLADGVRTFSEVSLLSGEVFYAQQLGLVLGH